MCSGSPMAFICGTFFEVILIYLIQVLRAGFTRRLRQQDLPISPRLGGHPPGLLCADLCGAFRGLESVVSRRTGRVRAHPNSRQGIGAPAVASGQEDRGPLYTSTREHPKLLSSGARCFAPRVLNSTTLSIQMYIYMYIFISRPSKPHREA